MQPHRNTQKLVWLKDEIISKELLRTGPMTGEYVLDPLIIWSSGLSTVHHLSSKAPGGFLILQTG